MAFAISPRAGTQLLVIATTAILVWFGYGLDPWWPLMWFAPIPVLLFSAHASWRSAAGAAGISWFLGLLSIWHYLHSVLGVPFFACLAILLGQALAFTVAVLLWRALLLRGASWSTDGQTLLVQAYQPGRLVGRRYPIYTPQFLESTSFRFYNFDLQEIGHISAP